MLPPFILSGIILLLGGIILIVVWQRSKLRVRSKTAESSKPTLDTLEQLSTDYQQGGLSEEVLFCRLADLVAEGLVRPVRPARQTTDEILHNVATDGALGTEEFRSAEFLLNLCDQVKFACYQPAEQEVRLAFITAAILLKRPAGARP
jgi:hypothetical protein